MIKKETTYTDEETGQIYREYNRYIPEKFNDKGYLFKTKVRFVREFCDQDYPAEMSVNDIGRFDLLCKKIYKDTNMLVEYTRAGIVPAGIKDISNTIQLAERQSRTYIHKLISLGLINKVNIKSERGIEIQYYVNPLYRHNGARLNLNLYLIFREQLDHVLPPWVKKQFAEAETKLKEAEKKVSQG